MLIETSLTEDYIPEWGLAESIREIISNSRDGEVVHGNKMNVYLSPSGVLNVENEGAEVPRDALLIGFGTKRDNTRTIGKFGEGLPLALMVLARNNMKVTINNRNESWSPLIEKSSKFNSKVLKIRINEKTKGFNGFRVRIFGVTEEAWNSIQKMFLFLNYPEDIVATTKGTLLKGEDYKHRVYVRGVFVHSDGDLNYGYDLKNAKIDRDRKMLDKFDLRWETAHILREAATKSKGSGMLREVYDLIEQGTEDTHHMSYALQAAERQTILGEFRSRHGEEAVPVRNLEQSRDIENLGQRGVIVSENLASVLEEELGKFDNIKETLARDRYTLVSWNDLTKDEQGNLEGAIDLIKEVDNSISLNNIDVANFASESMLGQYADERIRIAKKMLDNPEDALWCIAHEFAHHSTQMEDTEKGFSNKVEGMLSCIAVKVLEKYNNSLMIRKI